MYGMETPTIRARLANPAARAFSAAEIVALCDRIDRADELLMRRLPGMGDSGVVTALVAAVEKWPKPAEFFHQLDRDIYEYLSDHYPYKEGE